ncbi:hypothetical protein Nepgr_001226 [Nepenthes gracilis]|uniref:Uncharacterized protein n=1 Tax=Nepenthes gracilis TaxID=150966 RepID=A0AAD3RVX8_NEPGR|nr:hypothetical protein Nepgr_001226 [Nepenthes gracilis]
MISKELDEAEETISLSDLPISHDSSTGGENFPTRSFSLHGSGDDLFEFFRTDFKYEESDDIIFCGKVITRGKSKIDQIPQVTDSGSNSQRRSVQPGFLNWLPLSFTRVRSALENVSNCKTSHWRRISSSKSPPKMEYCRKFARSTKSSGRWYGYMFGSMRPPSEMELDDIKSRQKRQNPKASFRLCDGDGERKDTKLERSRSGGGHGLRGANGSSGCRGHRGIAVVRAISCIPSI